MMTAARKFIDRLRASAARLVDVQMVGRLVQNDHVGTEEGRKSQQQPRFFSPPDKAFDERVASPCPKKPIAPVRPAALWSPGRPASACET